MRALMVLDELYDALDHVKQAEKGATEGTGPSRLFDHQMSRVMSLRRDLERLTEELARERERWTP